MKYHFKIHREKKGYWAECVELPGCVTQGDNLEELKHYMEEVLNLYLDEPPNSKQIFSLPSKRKIAGKNIVQVSVEPKVALAFLLRTFRLQRKLTQAQTAKILGLKGLYSYQRLESAQTANPVFETIIRIKKAFPEIRMDELLAA